MDQSKYEVLKDSFFNCYKSYMDLITLNQSDNDLYNILVLRKYTSTNFINVNIIIKNSYYEEDDVLNEFSINIVLPEDTANELTNDITYDFISNHTIEYSSVNPRNLIHTLKSNNFTLNIRITSINEYKKILELSSNVNQNISKYKVLSKN